MSISRPLGVGSQALLHGDKMAGYYGEVTGLITANELRSKVGITEGTPMQSGDIKFLKYSHNNKTLFIPEKPISHSISWDNLHEKDLVFGKTVEIGGSLYLVRLIQGSSINPATNYNGDTPPATVTGQNSEWDSLLVPSVKSWNVVTEDDLGVLTGDGRYSWCQEVHSSNLTVRVIRGSGSVSSFYHGSSSSSVSVRGWRPVLELLLDLNAPPNISITSNQNLMVTGLQKSFALTGKVWDNERDDITVEATIAGVKKEVTVINPPSTEPVGDNFALIFDISEDLIEDGSYSEIVFKATDSIGGSTTKLWDRTITVGAGAYVNIVSKTYPEIKFNVQNPLENLLTKLDYKLNGVVKKTWVENIETEKTLILTEKDLNEGENTITLELTYGDSKVSFVTIKVNKSPLVQKPINEVDIRYNIEGQVREVATWLDHSTEVKSDFIIENTLRVEGNTGVEGISVNVTNYSYPTLSFRVQNTIKAKLNSVSVELNGQEIMKHTTKLEETKTVDLSNKVFNQGENLLEIKVDNITFREI